LEPVRIRDAGVLTTTESNDFSILLNDQKAFMNPLSHDFIVSGDIRGSYPKPLGNSQAKQIGLAVGTLIKEEKHWNIKVVIGHDNRQSSEALNRVLIEGLRNTGLKIVDSGLVSSPLLAYATRVSGASVGVMITGSHCPPEYNGLKFFVQGVPAHLSWMERLHAVLNLQTFRKGAGVVEKKNFHADYRNALVNAVAQNFKGLKIAVDIGNGTSTFSVPPVLEALHCQVELLNAESDGTYPGRGADSSRSAALDSLGERVRKTKAQLGVAFNGDGDCANFVDEKGREVPNDVILCLFAADFLRREKNAGVVYDGECSDLVERTVRDLGGTPFLEKTGHSFIFNRMKKEKACLGGEAGGHFFLPGFFPGDALYACLRLLEILKGGQGSLSAACNIFHIRVSIHGADLKMPVEMAGSFFETIKKRALEKGAKVSTLDGVRAVFDEGWGIIRPAAESFLSYRFEASTSGKLTQFIKTWLSDYPDSWQEILEKLD
jgi:phosphomannomutase/phosphoglucomutase